MNIEKLKQAGKIAAQTAEYAKSFIKPGMKLIDIAEKTEQKIIELGAKPAFPVNLSINDMAAHHTPAPNEETKAQGLLKVDLGVHINGYIADLAFSIDLENSDKNKKLIESAEKALENAIKTIKVGIELREIGKAIQDSIVSSGFSPVRNLSGHELKQFKLHAGLTIPNSDNTNATKLQEGIYAIEPFATTGQGIVYEGKPSGIYRFLEKKPIRDAQARKILLFIEENYSTLPFCSRWIVKKFGTRALLTLNQLEQVGILHHYKQLIEKSHEKVSQAEHTIIVSENKVEITTKN